MRSLALILLLPVASAANAADCRDMVFEQTSYTTCAVTADEDLRLFYAGSDGAFGNFQGVDADLAASGKALGFAMNAGMFHRDLAPVGLYLQDGVETAPLVTRDGPGNFGLLPNGVFCISDPDAETRFAVIESLAYQSARPNCRFASQSGPMLVIGGALHPRFLASSASLNLRNGVGVAADGRTAIFAISNSPVNFHSFARLFRDALNTPNALYFDGSISRLYAPSLGRHDGGFPIGPIVGTVVPKG